MLTMAVCKGRIYRDAEALLVAVGIEPLDDPNQSRKLTLNTRDPNVKLLMLRALDVPTFVQRGTADMGITGKDTLLEYDGDGIYEPIDLEISRCRLVVAGLPKTSLTTRRPRVATKYVASARRYFAARGQQAEIIALYGSVEIAPRAGIADVIVDIVDTGETLQANGLEVIEEIAEITARLIVNKASMKIKHVPIRTLMQRIDAVVSARRQSTIQQ